MREQAPGTCASGNSTSDAQRNPIAAAAQQQRQRAAAAAIAARDLQAWMLDLGEAVRAVVAGPFQRERRLAGWETLRKGVRVRVVDGLDELRRLCDRPAPGADESVSWNDDMAAWAGSVCTVVRTGDAAHKNYILRREGEQGERTFSFPYDAVLLMADH